MVEVYFVHINSNDIRLVFCSIQALVYVGLGRIEEAIQILNSIVQRDVPEHVTVRGDEIFDEVVSFIDCFYLLIFNYLYIRSHSSKTSCQKGVGDGRI